MKSYKNLVAGLFTLFMSTALFCQTSNKVKDQGITSPIHEKFVEKIVFSKTEIKKDGAVEASFGKEFSIKDQIFFRVYLKESIYNALCDKGYSVSYLDRDSEFYIVIKMDNEPAFSRMLYIRGFLSPDDKKVFTTFRGCFKKQEDEIGALDWKDFLEKYQQSLSPGKHNIKVEIYGRAMSDKPDYNGIILAQGDFVLNVSANFIDPNDPSVCLPKPSKTEPVLEAKMMAAAKAAIAQAGWKNETVKVIIKSIDWEIVKNEITHKIIKRRMDAFVASKKEGKCLYQLYTFSQDYTGSGYQDKTYVSALPMQDFNIHCDCMKTK